MTREQLKKVALVLDILVAEVCKKSHKLVDSLTSAGPSRMVLLINEAILEQLKCFGRPSSLLPMAKWAERRHCVPSKGFK